MAIIELPDLETFFVARTPPANPPHWDWFKVIVERVRAANGPTVRAYHWGWDADWDTVSFWHLPAAPLSIWTPAEPYTIAAGHGSKVQGAKLDFARLDRAFELMRTIPSAVSFTRLTVGGFVDKPRRSRPHVEANLQRYRGAGTWSVDARFHEPHPGLQAGESPAEVSAPARERLEPVAPFDRAGQVSDPLCPTRSGLVDPEEAYRLFQLVIEAAIPRPTVWRVDFEIDAYQWPNWTEALNAFDLGWCYGGHLHPPHGFDLYRRPSLVHPAHPIRIPIASWKPGAPPRLQMSMVHTSEATWLEFETAKGREKLEELLALVRPLEVWEGPPQLRWTS